MEELVFFDSGDVLVTNPRFIVFGQTYAMSNVTSVGTRILKPDRTWPIIFLIIGLLLLIWGGRAFWLGPVFGAIGVSRLIRNKTNYSVVLNTSAGENQALTSKSKEFIEEVVSALNNSIVSRG
ncbi:DUF6232 family protein [Akkermansiaceae bacterium]|nr:DUF6232 family protein [Akkermansiaceae bacterium]